MSRQISQIVYFILSLGLLINAVPVHALVAVELNIGSCNIDESMDTGSLDGSCSQSDSGFVGSGAARAEPGFLGATLTKDQPGSPAVFAHSFWFDEVAITSGDSSFAEGGSAYMVTTLVLEGDVTVNDPGSFINVIVEFGINETGGATAEFDLTDFTGGSFSEAISFINHVNLSPALTPELDNYLVMSLTIEGNGSFIADFYGTLAATTVSLAENEDGSGVFDTIDLGDNSLGSSLEFSPVPIPAAVWLFGSAVIMLGMSNRKSDSNIKR